MRRFYLLLGCLTLLVSWVWPLPIWAHQTFSGHMTMHMSVVAVAAPLLALGVAGRRYDPVRKVPRLFAPVPASMFEFVVVWAWHAPGLHHIARHHPAGLAAEQGTFLLSGLWLWLASVGGEMPRPKGRTAAGVIGLLLTSMHMTLLGALLALAPRPLYAHHHGTSGLPPLDDQHLGGAIMILGGGVVYLIGGVWLTVGLLRSPSPSVGAETT